MLAPTIAVIHTDSSFLDLLHDLLPDEGYRVLPLDIRDAATAVSDALPALVILDLWVDTPLDGWNLLLQLRGDVATTGIPAILLSEDHRFTEHKVVSLAAMNCTVLNKPFDLDDLLAAVEARIGALTTAGERATCAPAPQLIPPDAAPALHMQHETGKRLP